jgi:hypothetical protein
MICIKHQDHGCVVPRGNHIVHGVEVDGKKEFEIAGSTFSSTFQSEFAN